MTNSMINSQDCALALINKAQVLFDDPWYQTFLKSIRYVDVYTATGEAMILGTAFRLGFRWNAEDIKGLYQDGWKHFPELAF